MKNLFILIFSTFLSVPILASDKKPNLGDAPPCSVTVTQTISVSVMCPDKHTIVTTTQNVSGTGVSRTSCDQAYVAARSDLNTNVQTATKTIEDSSPSQCPPRL